MASLMESNRTLLSLSHHLRLFLQTTDDTIHRSKKIFLAHTRMPMTSSNQGSLVAHVSNVSSAETRSLTSKEIEIEVVSLLDRPQVNIEDSLTLAQFRQVHMNLTVKTPGTQQS